MVKQNKMDLKMTHSVKISPARREIRFDPKYFRTVPGVIQSLLIIFNLTGFIFICIQIWAFSYNSTAIFFNSIAIIGFLFTGILLVSYVFHVIEKYDKLPWLKVEFIFNALCSLMYLIAATCAVIIGSNWFTAAAVFGYCCMVLYGYDAYAKYQIYRSTGIAQTSETNEEKIKFKLTA